MTRRDWLLLLVASDDGDRRGLDPLRIQKGLFLLAQEGGLPRPERYWFVAYNYGPMSPRVYKDVEVLVRRGLFERLKVNGNEWRHVRATAAGHDAARALLASADGPPPATLECMRGIRRLVVGLDFSRLLARIYDRYPRYAERSVFRRP